VKVKIWGYRQNIRVDWAAFADDWRSGYDPAMAAVRQGHRPWTTIDVLHREILDGLLIRYGITGLNEAEIADFNRAWHG
jgi:2-haloacid dehalogenase